MKKKDWPYKILLSVLDLAILAFVYIVPEAHFLHNFSEQYFGLPIFQNINSAFCIFFVYLHDMFRQ
jgi:hypothetical protein